MRIIVVEDDRMMRDSIRDWLERQGHEVRILSDAEAFCPETSCRCQDNQCCADVLLCDMKLPGRSGLDVAIDLRRKACRIPRIGIMSGWWTAATLTQTQGLDVGVFRKPAELGRLLKWVTAHAESGTGDRELVNHPGLGY